MAASTQSSSRPSSNSKSHAGKPAGKKPRRVHKRGGNNKKRVQASKPGADLLKEIKKFQASYTLLIPGLPMQSLVQEVMAEVQPDCKYRIQRSAIKALEESMECFVTTWFTAANLAALHSKRVTLMVKDLDLVREMSAVIGGPSIHEVMRQKGQQATKTTITEQVVEIVEDN